MLRFFQKNISRPGVKQAGITFFAGTCFAGAYVAGIVGAAKYLQRQSASETNSAESDKMSYEESITRGMQPKKW